MCWTHTQGNVLNQLIVLATTVERVMERLKQYRKTATHGVLNCCIAYSVVCIVVLKGFLFSL
jgi:hypothetical protein